MFTGLVEARGTLERRSSSGSGSSSARVVIRGDFEGGALVLGESIAVDGVCLTVAAIVRPGPGGAVFEADVSAETLAKTTLGALPIGAHVNLERALAIGGRMGGHIVSGHVDGVGRIAQKSPLDGSVRVVFEAPRELMRFIATKGSICVSGVSLTVNEVWDDRFSVVLVPHTREKTSLDALAIGGRVNLEVDLLARYVARLLEHGRSPSPPPGANARGGSSDEGTASGEGSASKLGSGTETGSLRASDAALLERLRRAGYL